MHDGSILRISNIIQVQSLQSTILHYPEICRYFKLKGFLHSSCMCHVTQVSITCPRDTSFFYIRHHLIYLRDTSLSSYILFFSPCETYNDRITRTLVTSNIVSAKIEGSNHIETAETPLFLTKLITSF